MSRFACALLCALHISQPAVAQDEGVATVLPIADVIQAFKDEIRDAQVRSPGRCQFAIRKVDFTFLAQTRLATTTGAGAEFSVFGIKIGGGVEDEEGNTRTSRIKIAFEPRQGGGMEEVGGGAEALQGFGDLIRNTKQQIETASAADNSLTVSQVVIQTGFKLERESSGKIKVIATGEVESGAQDQHEVVLTLGPASGGGC